MVGGPDLTALRESYIQIGRPLSHLPPPASIAVWPENAAAVALWIAMQGQWVMGNGGPIALRQEIVPLALRQARVRRRDRRMAQLGLRVMEGAALEWLREKAEEAAAKVETSRSSRPRRR